MTLAALPFEQHWAFAATTATIVSGAVAERCTIVAYIVYASCLIGFIYPCVAQLVWGGNGYMSAWLGSDDQKDYFRGCGVIDFAGSGVVHMTGGVAALVGATCLGPRKSFVENNINLPSCKFCILQKVLPLLGGLVLLPFFCMSLSKCSSLLSRRSPPFLSVKSSDGPVFQTLGTLILWFGWYDTETCLGKYFDSKISLLKTFLITALMMLPVFVLAQVRLQWRVHTCHCGIRPTRRQDHGDHHHRCGLRRAVYPHSW